MISNQELKDIKNRLENTSKGTWQAFVEDRDFESGSSFIKTEGDDIELIGATEADYDFIAHAKEDISKLLDEIERLR